MCLFFGGDWTYLQTLSCVDKYKAFKLIQK